MFNVTNEGNEMKTTLPPLFGIASEVKHTEDLLTIRKIAEMPADAVKQLVLDRLAQGLLSGLSEPLGIEEQVAQALRLSLAGLQARP